MEKAGSQAPPQCFCCEGTNLGYTTDGTCVLFSLFLVRASSARGNGGQFRSAHHLQINLLDLLSNLRPQISVLNACFALRPADRQTSPSAIRKRSIRSRCFASFFLNVKPTPSTNSRF